MENIDKIKDLLKLLNFDECIAFIEKLDENENYNTDIFHEVLCRMENLDTERFIEFSESY